MKFKNVTIAMLSSMLTLTGCVNNKDDIHNNATTKQLFNTAQQNYLLLDVRTPKEYAQDGVKNAVLIPYDTVKDQVSILPQNKNTPIKVYCRSGRRAGIAKEVLTNMGYTHVENLKTVSAANVYLSQNPLYK